MDNKEHRYICKNFDENCGVCKFARPYCVDPFSEDSCLEFQRMVTERQKYPYDPEPTSLYEPSGQIGFKRKSRKDILWILDGAKHVAECFVPDREFEMFDVPKHIVFEDYRKECIDKLKPWRCDEFYTVRGYEFASDLIGTLFIAISNG